MRHGPFVLRAVALLSAGMFAVHDLRYRLGSGHGDHALEHAHGYLSAIGPVVALLVLAAAAHLLHLAARGHGAAQRRRSTAKLWALSAAALLAAFGAQELIEGALAHGHPEGLPAIFGAGGWIAVPLALAIGGLVALLLRGADEVLRAASRSRIALARLLLVAGDVSAPHAQAFVAPPAPLAGRGAGRAPPLVCA
jgi:hypothetical protein